MPNQQLQMPSGFGGLMRYNEEYNSTFKFSPIQVLIFVIALALAAVLLKFFFPINPIA